MVVVVTGASGALGSAVVVALSQRHRVAALVSPRSFDKARAAFAGNAGVFVASLEGDGGFASAVARVEAELGPPDGAVLVAGSWAGGKPIADAPENELADMFEANVATAHTALRSLLPGMLARTKGSVVVVGSRAAARPWSSANAASYAASKAALVALAEVAAAEGLESGVRVNAVLPSTIDTPANRAAMPAADASRWVSTASLADVIAFLLSDAARDVSGAAIPVYGRA